MKTVQIESIDELVSNLNSYENHFVYRGHTEKSWTLESSIRRIFTNDKLEDRIRKAETFSLEQFKSKFHLYDTTNKTPTTKLEWLSLMQHYGVPTRLLDFTESPYVALYFAIETYNPRQEDDFALYAIDYRSTLQRSIDEIKKSDKAFSYTYEDAQRKQDEIYEKVIDRFSYDILWVTEPKEVNLRLDRQAGCFLLSGNLTKTIEEILLQTQYEDIEAYKLIIPKQFYENIFALLKKVNITSNVIYGDIGGLAKSIRMTVFAYS